MLLLKFSNSFSINCTEPHNRLTNLEVVQRGYDEIWVLKRQNERENVEALSEALVLFFFVWS